MYIVPRVIIFIYIARFINFFILFPRVIYLFFLGELNFYFLLIVNFIVKY